MGNNRNVTKSLAIRSLWTNFSGVKIIAGKLKSLKLFLFAYKLQV